MPKFDFKCKECGKIVESDNANAKIHCDCYGEPEMRRQFTFGGAVLKGSGWYSVDKRKTDGGTIGIDP